MIVSPVYLKMVYPASESDDLLSVLGTIDQILAVADVHRNGSVGYLRYLDDFITIELITGHVLMPGSKDDTDVELVLFEPFLDVGRCLHQHVVVVV